MLVDDNPVPYPRQYLTPADMPVFGGHPYAGWVVPHAGAPAYYVWWDGCAHLGLLRAEAALAQAGYVAATYQSPHLISARVLEHAKGKT